MEKKKGSLGGLFKKKAAVGGGAPKKGTGVTRAKSTAGKTRSKKPGN